MCGVRPRTATDLDTNVIYGKAAAAILCAQGLGAIGQALYTNEGHTDSAQSFIDSPPCRLYLFPVILALTKTQVPLYARPLQHADAFVVEAAGGKHCTTYPSCRKSGLVLPNGD